MKLAIIGFVLIIGGGWLYQFSLAAQATVLPPKPVNQPTQPDLSATPVAKAIPAATAATCPDALVNGGFEEDSSWWINDVNTHYDTSEVHNGDRALAMNTLNGKTAEFWQRLTIPANATAVTLDFDSFILAGSVDENFHVSLYDTHFNTLLQTFSVPYTCECSWSHFAPTLDVTAFTAPKVNLLM